MSRKTGGSLSHQILMILTPMIRFSNSGEHNISKNTDKKVFRYRSDCIKNYIYSQSTFDTYVKQCNNFCKWCHKVYSGDCNTVEKCKAHIQEYIDMCKDRGDSAHSLSMYASAIRKLYRADINKGEAIDIKLPRRQRCDITRSRNHVITDEHFSVTKNADLIAFCKSTGLRRRELGKLCGSDLKYFEDKWCIEVNKGTKGGRPRISEIVGDIDKVKNMMEAAGNGRVFKSIPAAADIHSYRSDYAMSIYKKYARDEIPEADKYRLKKEFKGIVLDRQAMDKVSHNLGHNRIDVFSSNYYRQ